MRLLNEQEARPQAVVAKLEARITDPVRHVVLAAAIGFVCALTAGFGMLLSRGVASHPPLAILRGEG